MSFLKTLRRYAWRLAGPSVHRALTPNPKQWDLIGAANRASQLSLMLHYRQLVSQGHSVPSFDDVQLRCYSQNGEDGILLLVFALIGTTNKKCAEIGAGDGIECNCANLILNHGWTGLLLDGNRDNIERGRGFYRAARDTFLWPPKLVHAWVTAENVNDLLRSNGCEGPIDLLSLDLDGMDWWVWKAIECIDPRVVVLEYNNLWGPDDAVTVPYDPQFASRKVQYGADYAGASLAAFVKLGREKGYRLVGCERYGFNAFFIQRGLGEELLPEIPAAQCFAHPFAEHARSTRIQNVLGQPWQRV